MMHVIVKNSEVSEYNQKYEKYQGGQNIVKGRDLPARQIKWVRSLFEALLLSRFDARLDRFPQKRGARMV